MENKLKNENQDLTIENVPNEIESQENKPKFIEIQTKTTLFSYVLWAMIIFGICFISFFFVFQVLLTQIGVHGYSMQPTINSQATGTNGDQQTDTVFYLKTKDYNYKDIVIIKEGKTSTGTEMLIKRVIATPGQTLTIKNITENGLSPELAIRIYINGEQLEEDYILTQNMVIDKYPSTVDVQYPFYLEMLKDLKDASLNYEFSITLGENEYFVMGDNRNNSVDSRYFGPITNEDILGKVVLHVEYGDSLMQAIYKNIFSTRLLYSFKTYRI